jgi:hypothetical protein
MTYKDYGYKKHCEPVPSGFTYASEVARRHRRRLLRNAVMLLMIASIGMLLIMVGIIAITPLAVR